MNLLKETKEAIRDSGHKPSNIVFIGSRDGEYRCSWDEFKLLADVEYDAGFGAQEVATDLIIVFGDGQTMWRGEYDGSEWWDFSRPFKMPESSKPIMRLTADEGLVGWASLGEIHQ